MEAAVPISYRVASEAKARRALHALQAHFYARSEKRPPRRATYYDTFDWRIHADGSSLSATAVEGGLLLSWNSSDGIARHRLRTETMPAFANDLPTGTFRDALAPVVEMRRLLPLVEVEIEGRTLRLLDGEEKTVARIELDVGRALSTNSSSSVSALEPHITLLPVQGYPNAHRRAVEFIEHTLELSRSEGGTFEMALAAIGIRPDRYSSKLRIVFEPDLRAVDAVTRMLCALLDTMVANEVGTRSDLDSEFLHDFRVAVRRTRTCLAQIKDVLPPEPLARYQREFSWLGEIAGPTRDLDVYLLNIETYRSWLPAAVARDLDPLWSFLHDRQQVEQRRLRGHLESERYRSLVESWRRFLDDSVSTADEASSNVPILALATERIDARWTRVIEKGSKIHSRSPVERLHRLRIDCKKLRYLLEFFRSLYSPAETSQVIGELKTLQDNLGEINDLRVQQDTLTTFAREMIQRGEGTADTLLAMGRLSERLERRRVKQRKHFQDCFTAFAAPQNQKRMQALLRGNSESSP